MKLPKFIGLKTKYNNKYLRYIDEDTEVHGLHQFSGDTVVSGYAKFEVEEAKIGNGLVHIRSVYNNKYWARWSPNHWWIAANADEPEEDKSKWSCTLFEPIRYDSGVNGDFTMRLRHVQLGHFTCLWRAAAPYNSCLFAGSAEQNKELLDVFSIFIWETLFVLPKYVAFKGDNGSYLKGNRIKEMNFLTFEGDDISDPAVAYEVFNATAIGDGTVGIKSRSFDKFWLRGRDWVVAESNESNSNDVNALFFPQKVENNVVALKNLGNRLFCKRFTDKGITGGVSALVSAVTLEAQFEVQEVVDLRDIENINFRLSDGRIYGKKVTILATGIAENRLLQPVVIDVNLSYEETSVISWSSTVSVKLGVETSIRSRIPIVFDEKLAIASEFSGEYKWGEAKTSTKQVESVYRVLVPPSTRVRVYLKANQASCDVPFSYTQNDTLINWEKITQNLDDGIYTGVNIYNLKYETQAESLV